MKLRVVVNLTTYSSPVDSTWEKVLDWADGWTVPVPGDRLVLRDEDDDRRAVLVFTYRRFGLHSSGRVDLTFALQGVHVRDGWTEDEMRELGFTESAWVQP